jgi:hypothetical protein
MTPLAPEPDIRSRLFPFYNRQAAGAVAEAALGRAKLDQEVAGYCTLNVSRDVDLEAWQCPASVFETCRSPWRNCCERYYPTHR